MAFDFPSSPAEGQIFNAPGGPSYVFNTPVWKAVGQGQIAIISDTPPASPANGALWYESDSGVLYIWYNDGNSSQWVQVGGVLGPGVPPSDGNEYVMVNGVWRLSRQSFSFGAVGTFDITVPDWGPTKAKISGTIQHAAAYYNCMRVSSDGTTFLAGATDYAQGGGQILSNSTAVTNTANATSSLMYVSGTSDHLTLPSMWEVTVTLVRTGTMLFGFWGQGKTFGTNGVYYTMLYHGAVQSTAFTSIKALRWMTNTAAAVTQGRLTVEWLP